jgi:aryl-phospho-beta-D-glucosidase BglC (GH1 family)
VKKNNMRYRLFITARFLNIILILIFLLNESSAQGFLKAEGKRIVNAKGENVILRGEGFGGWMLQEGYMLGIYKNSEQHNIKKGIEALIGPEETEGFYDAWLHNFIQKIDIDLMHAWGFNSVRLPMHYNLYTLPVDQEPIAGQNTWLDKGFTMTDSLLAWCRANHIYLILDLHAAPGGQGNDVNISDRDDSNPSLWQSEANQEKTISLWKKLAERYKDEPWIGGYDILNEPNWGFTDTINDRNGLNEKWNGSLKKLMQKITAAIRQVDKNHMIIIEGNGWGNNYNGILPTWDNNMVLSFHKYWNYNRKQQIQQILDTRNNYNVPVWLGETGENSNVWFTEAIKLLEENNIGWSMWPLKKMGANNPLEIKSNPNYDSVRNFLNGHGPVPSANSAVKGLMELAKDVKLENNIFHKDVIDAMFRQPFSETAIPFHLYNLEENLTINAVDFDLGRNGVAYFDLDTADYHTSGKPGVGNRGHVYRNDGVDIYKDSSKNNTYYVGDIGNTEWLQYTIHVQKDGNYKMIFSYMPGKDEGKLSVISNGKSLLNEVTVPAATDNENKWQQLDLKNIHLDSGTNRVRIYAVKGGFKLENIQFLR